MLAALAIATTLGFVSAPPPARLTDPYQIFARARAYWMRQRYPAEVNYEIVEQAVKDGHVQSRHYTARWWASDGGAVVDAVSREEREHPYRPPPGFTLSILFLPVATIGGPKRGTGVNTDLVGVPQLAPNYAFAIAPYVPPSPPTAADLVRDVRAEYHDPLCPGRAAKLPSSQLPTIAVVSVANRHYTMTLVGVEPYGDHLDYHLALRPVVDPQRYRLRALWIDTRTFATDKLEQDGNFTTTSATRVPWTVTFHDIDGARYIDTESESEPLAKGPDALSDASFTFVDVAAGDDRRYASIPPFGALVEPADSPAP